MTKLRLTWPSGEHVKGSLVPEEESSGAGYQRDDEHASHPSHFLPLSSRISSGFPFA